MPEDTTARSLMSDLQEKMNDEMRTRSMEDLVAILKSINDKQRVISDILKDQRGDDIKEKVQGETTADEPDRTQTEQSDTDREMGALRKVFAESFSSIKDAFTPGGLFKSFGLLTGSPLFMLMGDKFDDLISKYREYNEESKKSRAEQAAVQKEAMADDFMKEERREEELELSKQQIGLLEDIREKEFTVSEKKGGIGGMLAGLLAAPFSLLTKILPKSLAGIFGKGFLGKLLPAAGGGLLGGGLLKGGAGIGKLLKGGGRLLGKIALPLALVTGGFDFVKGFRNALEITGREDLTAKIQAGISEVISGFTFGLLDSKVISKGIDFLTDKLKDIFFAPLELLRDVTDGEGIMRSVSNYMSKFTFGLMSSETIFNGVEMLRNAVVSMFRRTLDSVLELAADVGPRMLDGIAKAVSGLTFGMISPDQVSEAATLLTEKITGLIHGAWNSIRSALSKLDIIGSIGELADTGMEKIGEQIEFFKTVVQDRIDSILRFVEEPLTTVKSFFNKISSAFGFEIEEPGAPVSVAGQDGIMGGFRRNIGTDGLITGGRDEITAVRVPNATLERVNTERIRERQVVREREIVRERRRTEEKTNNIISTNTQNNVVLQEDMRVGSDDVDWAGSMQY